MNGFFFFNIYFHIYVNRLYLFWIFQWSINLLIMFICPKYFRNNLGKNCPFTLV
jgi:hypothetical protein